MLKIRSQQMEAFRRQRADELPINIKAYLREKCPQETGTMDEPAMDALVASGMAAAANCKIESEWDLCRFCWMELLHGPEFHEKQEWAKVILTDRDIAPDERVNLLEQHHLSSQAAAAAPASSGGHPP